MEYMENFSPGHREMNKEGLAYMPDLTGKKKKRSKFGNFFRSAVLAGSMLLPTIGYNTACKQPTVVDIDRDKDGVLNIYDNCPDDWNPDQLDSNNNGIGDVCEDPVEVRYNLDVMLNGLGNGQQISNFTVTATGPETKIVNASNGVCKLDNLLEGPYKLTLKGGFYGGHDTDGVRYATRYVNLGANSTYQTDVVEDGWVDVDFLENTTRLFVRGGENPLEGWRTTPEFVIYKKTTYNGNEYTLTDDYINTILTEMIQTDIPFMHQGDLFSMGTPNIIIRDEYVGDPLYAPYEDGKVLTFPYWKSSQHSQNSTDGIIRAGHWYVNQDHDRGTVLHEGLHIFEFGDYDGPIQSIMGETNAASRPTLDDKKTGMYKSSRDPLIGRYDVYPKPDWFAGALSAAIQKHASSSSATSVEYGSGKGPVVGGNSGGQSGVNKNNGTQPKNKSGVKKPVGKIIGSQVPKKKPLKK